MISEKMITSGLDEIGRTFAKILEPDAASVLESAKAEVRSSRIEYLKRQRRTDDPSLTPKPWGYTIDFDRPLRFRETDCRGLDAKIDVCCAMRWTENDLPIQQEIALRLWNSSVAFRDGWDHPNLEEIFADPSRDTSGRVIFRCHFDLANLDQEGPRFHLQYGGNAGSDEYCWFPSSLKLPRLVHHPMDLVLLCQLVAANFFPTEYQQKYRDDSQWLSVIYESQEYLLREYYKTCMEVIADRGVLLDSLWNTAS